MVVSVFLRSILFSIILLLIPDPGIVESRSLECDQNDFRALSSFHNQLDTPIDGWDGPASNCCLMAGVLCDNSSSRVVGLVLGGKKLEGTMAGSLMNLGHLKVLNLSRNLLRGLLPGKMFQMQNLEVLDLSCNEFSGSFHVDIYLPSIRSFNISNNNFFGHVEVTSLCHNAPYIENLDLSGNNFNGKIPKDIADCSSLQRLFLNNNDMSGILPDAIFHLRNLRELHVQGNSLSGWLDNKIGELIHLVKLDISDNSFLGQLPDSFSGLLKLEEFSARSNMFTGPLPVTLTNSHSLAVLLLGNNSLTGPITINCSAMQNLTSLDLQNNHLQGPIPGELSKCRRMRYLRLGRNPLKGELPSSFRSLEALMHLDLSNASLVNLSAAVQTLQHCGNLTTLMLPKNFYDEEIPQNPELQLRFQRLKTLVIPVSRLRGYLPEWLSGCPNLEILDLSWNNLRGKIPNWIGYLSLLFYLDLSSNNFTGDLPESLAKLRNLRDHNFSSLVDPSSSFSVYLSIPGRSSLRYNRLWNLPPTLDLSKNKLTGLILPGFGNLKGLHVLKLNNNSFSGHIPDSLSGMENLESMDLSQNNLSGEIPFALIVLNFMSYFNVSCNRLSGEVPSGGQFQTFPSSSFVGNIDLCGLPVIPCKSDSDDTNHMKVPPADGILVISQFGLPFGIGALTGFVLTVEICFISGWVYRK